MRRFIWPVGVLVALLVTNVIHTHTFFSVELRGGHLYGSIVDILRSSAPLALVALRRRIRRRCGFGDRRRLLGLRCGYAGRDGRRRRRRCGRWLQRWVDGCRDGRGRGDGCRGDRRWRGGEEG